MIYIDTTCLMKLLLLEPASHAVRQAVAREDAVVVSSLAELETEVQLKASYLGGELRASQWRQHLLRLAAFRNLDPFQFRVLGGSLFQTALRQHRRNRQIHCRTLDRLHLAAMEELRLNRLLTTDDSQ